jgi:hypothetical protein
VVLDSLGFDQFSTKCLERRESPSLIGSHEAAITDHVGSKNGRKPPFHTLFAHGTLPAGIIAA